MQFGGNFLLYCEKNNTKKLSYLNRVDFLLVFFINFMLRLIYEERKKKMRDILHMFYNVERERKMYMKKKKDW